MPGNIDELIAEVRREAEQADFPVDTSVYERSGRDPKQPILYAGSLDAPLCVVGRDLGKDEVRAGQPLIGAAGHLVREGIVRAWDEAGPDAAGSHSGEPDPERALEHAILTNTVPYKPPGNKAYAAGVRRRFRPYLERLLSVHWKGRLVITLGTEAFQWFAPYGESEAFESIGATEQRFDSVFPCRLPGEGDASRSRGKDILVYPLPHPSPLNQRWYSRFPSMLADRLVEVRRHLEQSTYS